MYSDFIRRKLDRIRFKSSAILISDNEVHPALYPFQRVITRRSLELGSCALFEDCGMGKTIQEMEWSKHINVRTGKPVLIFAPLAVGHQMVVRG